MIIDTHHHFWKYDPEQYDWIDESMSAIKKDFLPTDLQSTLSNTKVEGVVTVQARQIIEETDWLLELAGQYDFIKGVTGWLPLMSPKIGHLIEEYAQNQWLKGIRHVIQGEPDPAFILRDDFNYGIAQLKKFDLLYEILIKENQLPNTIKFVEKHPNQPFVLDHIAKPDIANNSIRNWQKNINILSKNKNVYCKLSGMVTEADYQNWSREQLKPYFDVLLETFGPSRLMFGSDWPVCLVASSYNEWLNVVEEQFKALSESEKNKIFAENAINIYQL